MPAARSQWRDTRLRHKVGERDGWICARCRNPIDPTLSGNHHLGPTLEHIIPIVLGGPTNEANCTVAHRHCNTTAGASLGGQRLAAKKRQRWVNPAW